jgi:hypothetical protein
VTAATWTILVLLVACFVPRSAGVYVIYFQINNRLFITTLKEGAANSSFHSKTNLMSIPLHTEILKVKLGFCSPSPLFAG